MTGAITSQLVSVLAALAFELQCGGPLTVEVVREMGHLSHKLTR